MDLLENTLKKYWGHPHFRPVQKEIIQSVLNQKDTLALLPTGGGKSVCFQVPALLMEGICLVITPLIALMKDQVEQLKKREIIAIGIYAGMSFREIDIALDRCIYDKIKFLYVSPERLKTDIFRERVKKMNVNLIAVDEAHCISQWGYDFRPSYLEIAHLRSIIQSTPVIALTATATKEVAKDIQEKLLFPKWNVFKKSFVRSNLSYACIEEENKEKKLVQILEKIGGSAVVYVRSRVRTERVAQFLRSKKILCSFYHAGMSHAERSFSQTKWINGETRVMVATNAFGMGIDKSNVRMVIHIDLPENIESYYQEAGRAGRDEKKAYAVLIFSKGDIIDLKEKFNLSYPELPFIKRVYQSIANFYKIAVGSSEFSSFDFEIDEFINVYNFKKREVHNALKILERESLLQLNTGYFEPSKIHFLLKGERLYDYQLMNAAHDTFIKGLLRIYGGEMFSNFVPVSEKMIATTFKIPEPEVIGILKSLNKNEVIIYHQKKEKPQLTFLTPRLDAATLPIDMASLQERKQKEYDKLEAIVSYCTQSVHCRNKALVEYFGEYYESNCNICDICRRKNRNVLPDSLLEDQMKQLLRNSPYTLTEILDIFGPDKSKEVTKLIRKMIDFHLIETDSNGKIQWVSDSQ